MLILPQRFDHVLDRPVRPGIQSPTNPSLFKRVQQVHYNHNLVEGKAVSCVKLGCRVLDRKE